MDIEGTEFTDNVLERFGSGQKFSGENLEKLLYVVEKKLTSISSRIEEIEVELEIEFKNLKTFSHNNHCECDPLAMQCFLNNVVQAAERYVGFEDHIVEILVDFCYHNCIVLPSSSLITGLSHHSINSFENDFSTDQTLLWSKLLIKMRNGLITMLGSLPMTNAENVSKEASPVEFVNYLNSRRFYLFQLLNALYSFDEAVSIYCKIRENQLLVNNGADDRDNPTKEIFKLENTMEIHCIMLSEDFKLFQSIFKDEMDLSPFNKLIAVYSQDICSKLREFTLFYHHDYFMKGSRVSTFTIKDLKLFANAISILHKWHDQVYGITIQLNIRKPQSTEFLFDVYESIREPWEWEKELIQFYPALSASVVSYLKCLPNAIFQDQKFSATIYISDEVLLMNPTYPKKVSYKCGQFLSLIFEMLVFKKMKEISEVVNATITEVLHEYYIYLKQVLNDFLANQRSIESLYMILCDCVLLESLLVQWEEKDLKKKHGIHYLLIQKFKSMKNDMINTISTYHLSTLRLALVYDCHANNWDEEQKFFEDERCSFTIQMWNFYIRGVMYDMIDAMPLALWHEIISKISNEMLIFFAARYSEVKPSYQRLPQIKVDLMVLLKSFHWLYLHLMDDELEFFDTGSQYKLFHALLTSLLHTMVILLAPLNLVSEVLEKSSLTNKNNLDWRDLGLSVCFNDKILIMLEILTTKQCLNNRLLLKFLKWNNLEASKFIFFYSDYLLNPIIMANKILNVNHMFVSEKIVKIQPIKKKQIANCFYDIFLNYSQTSFISFMASLIKDDFSKSFKKNDIEELPLWLQLVADNVSSILKRILKPAYELIFQNDITQAMPLFNFTKIQSLPCGCATVPVVKEKDVQSWIIELHECLMLTLNSLVDNIALFPKVIWLLLVHIKDEPNFAPSWIKQQHLGTKVLASLLYNWLSNSSNITHLSYKTNISPETHRRFKMFAELLWHVVYNLSYDVTENPKVSMEIYKYLQSSSKIIMEKLSDLDRWCNLSAMELVARENEINSKDLLIEPKNSSMMFVYSLIKFNKQSIKEIIMKKNAVSIERLREEYNTLKLSSEITFNPMIEFELIGDDNLVHSEFVSTEFDWSKLISAVPFSKWKELVMNRFEFQESAENMLLEHEKEAINRIKKTLEDVTEPID